MQTALADFVRDTPQGREANEILRSCVHCGFCLPTCPTYQLLGDELDSPRGRIYQIKQLLEGAPVSARTQLHLDRCLTCRACESACPSGVQYGRLLDIGRAQAELRLPRTPRVRLTRYLLHKVVPHTRRVRALLGLARALRGVLPRGLRDRLPAAAAPLPAALKARRPHWPAARHARRVVLLEGCVQPALAADINPATAQLLDRIGISALRASACGCCGMLDHHLTEHAAALAAMRRNVDALWPHVEAGAEAIVLTASACASMVADYGRLLRDEPEYAERALRISALTRDVSQLLAGEGAALAAALRPAPEVRVAFQSPCSLQHALKVRGVVETLLSAAGFTLTPVADGQRCCGSAGSYSLLQPQLSGELLRTKVQALEAGRPQVIATANIGCLVHLRSGTSVPVCHWVQLLAARLADG
ncbi:MAG TPA: glycolate oxidase subunit GlcF [Steroidobacteraceae bacterium]|nr:glycolate oxidase subunit GlcF [Steroidobacteraceae bacterium]